jgi:Leucine-rich repeat (LRR) protein
MDLSVKSIDDAVEEIMKIHKSLPARPGIEEVEAAKDLIRNVESEDQARLDAIARQKKKNDFPDELFMILQEMKKTLVHFQSMEQKREAMKLLDLENAHSVFDDLIQRASQCVPSATNSRVSTLSANLSSLSTTTAASNAVSSSSSLYYEKEPVKDSEMFTRDGSYLKKVKTTFYGDGNNGIGLQSGQISKPQILDSSLKPVSSEGQDGEKLSLIKLASLIEVSSKKGTRDLSLQMKLMDQIEWLPDSIGKLSSLITLDLSENRIVGLPATFGNLSSLSKLDLHSNRITELPETIGNLLSLVSLDASGNQLTNLPSTFGRLVRLQELDLSSNSLPVLPETIGSLVSLKKLNIETNDIEEIPHTILHCSSLTELHADYNRLKALPEAVGKIVSLEILSVRYNNINRLPTTMASLSSLKELNMSFNELESLPESLCFATSLVKLNISNNFADMQSLPRSIGNLEMLQEFDMSNNQIRFLPDSFRMLTKLSCLNVEGNPLEVPPRNITELGAQYMADLVAKRDVKPPVVKEKKSWTAQICFFSKSYKRKRNRMDYVKA